MLISRHESLRTIFKQDEQGEIKQFIQSPNESGFQVNYADLRQLGQQALNELIQQDFNQPFDLKTGPLLRVGLYQVEDSKCVFTYVMHHIISDGWSMEILIRELLVFYNAYAKGELDPLPPLRVQYKDYAAWQQEQLSGEKLQAHKEFWVKEFEDGIPQLDVSNKKRPVQFSYKGDVLLFELDADQAAALSKITGLYGGTMFMSLLLVVKLLLYRYTGKNRIMVGTSLAGRNHYELENQIGLYLNNLPLITDVDNNIRLKELYDRVKSTVLNTLEHQVYPLDILIHEIDYVLDQSRPGLFNVVVELQTPSADGIEGKTDFTIQPFGMKTNTSMFDLNFDFLQVNDQLKCSISYNTSLFGHKDILLMKKRLIQLLMNIADNYTGETSVGDIDFKLDQEKKYMHLNTDAQEIF
jgi:hypothetical protein